MNKEITIIAVEHDHEKPCVGCVLSEIDSDCKIELRTMKLLGLCDCTDGYIYKLKEENEV